MTRRKQAGRVVVATAAGYLVGTFPSADLAARFATRGSTDLRADGGNPGALNAAQQLGKKWGLAVLLSDAGKGAIAGVLGRAIGGPNGGYAAAGASIAGHIVPVWNGFRGGKGVATSAGACLAVFPVYFPLDASVAAAGALGSRNAEMSVRLSCVAFIVASVVWWRLQWPNGWGPQVTLGLPAMALAGSAMILTKFATARRAVARG
jgi:acyl phosphate:glycerol-3-phosphate acyltransferase